MEAAGGPPSPNASLQLVSFHQKTHLKPPLYIALYFSNISTSASPQLVLFTHTAIPLFVMILDESDQAIPQVDEIFGCIVRLIQFLPSLTNIL